MIDLAILVAFS